MARKSFSLVAFRNLVVNVRMGWLGGGWGWEGKSSSVVGETWVALLLFRASSRLRTWLVGVQQTRHFWC